MTFEELTTDINKSLHKDQTTERYNHIQGVKELACRLAQHYCLDVQKVTLAALLHDCMKHKTRQQLVEECESYGLLLDEDERVSHGLLHGKVAYIYAQKHYQILDEDILFPILYHTTGREKMSKYEKVLFITDYCEVGREIEKAHGFFNTALESLDRGMLEVVKAKLQDVIQKNLRIHQRTCDLYHELIRTIHAKPRDIS